MNASFLQINQHLPKILIIWLILNNVGVTSLFGVEYLIEGEIEGVVQHSRD